MIELTMVDLALIIMLGVACAGWAQAKEREKHANTLLRLFIEDEGARKQVLEAHARWVKENEA